MVSLTTKKFGMSQATKVNYSLVRSNWEVILWILLIKPLHNYFRHWIYQCMCKYQMVHQLKQVNKLLMSSWLLFHVAPMFTNPDWLFVEIKLILWSYSEPVCQSFWSFHNKIFVSKWAVACGTLTFILTFLKVYFI